MRRVLSLAAWGFLGWGVLTWTLTLEQLLFGVGVSVLVAVSLACFGEVKGPWWFLRPHRMVGLAKLVSVAAGRIVVANVKLAIRIWSPRRPLSSGMVVVPTEARSDGGLAAVALISSLIVDNQIVDLDRTNHLLQYHAVTVPEGDRIAGRRAINGPIEDLLAPLEEGRE